MFYCARQLGNIGMYLILILIFFVATLYNLHSTNVSTCYVKKYLLCISLKQPFHFELRILVSVWNQILGNINPHFFPSFVFHSGGLKLPQKILSFSTLYLYTYLSWYYLMLFFFRFLPTVLHSKAWFYKDRVLFLQNDRITIFPHMTKWW